MAESLLGASVVYYAYANGVHTPFAATVVEDAGEPTVSLKVHTTEGCRGLLVSVGFLTLTINAYIAAGFFSAEGVPEGPISDGPYWRWNANL